MGLVTDVVAAGASGKTVGSAMGIVAAVASAERVGSALELVVAVASSPMAGSARAFVYNPRAGRWICSILSRSLRERWI